MKSHEYKVNPNKKRKSNLLKKLISKYYREDDTYKEIHKNPYMKPKKRG